MNLLDPAPNAGMPMPAARYSDEAARLGVVQSFEAAALEGDQELQDIVKFAARLCKAPISMVTLLEHDRQRFLACAGVNQRETPREIAFCNHTLGKPAMLEVLDAKTDPRFADNPLVTKDPHIRYFAGQPLVSDEGASLGTLCVIDSVARTKPLDDFQREGMAVLARAVMRRLETRRSGLRADRAIAERDVRLKRMIESLPQIAWSADNQGNFDYFNKRWREVTGAPPPKTAMAWREFLHPEDFDTVFAQWQERFAAGKRFDAEYRLKRADGSWMWVLAMAVPVADNEGEPERWFGTVTDIDAVHQAMEERDLLARELAHRIKNIFAVIIGLAMLKARKAPEHEPFARDLTRALQALGRAHEFVRPGSGVVQDSLKGLLQALFAPYSDSEDAPRVRIEGEDAAIGQRAATPLALVFHELATNSAKYGALSSDAGHVDLTISDKGDAIGAVWQEHGGPAAKQASESGFGSRLVEMSVTGQLQGTWERRFEPDGLIVEMTFAKAALTG